MADDERRKGALCIVAAATLRSPGGPGVEIAHGAMILLASVAQGISAPRRAAS